MVCTTELFFLVTRRFPWDLCQSQCRPSLIRGTVTDARSGTPLVGASLTVVEERRGVVTAGDGTYSLTGIVRTSFTLTASAVGYLSMSRQVTVAQPGRTTIDVQLQPASGGDITISALRTAAVHYAAESEVEADITLANSSAEARAVRLYVQVVDAGGGLIWQAPKVQVPLGADPRSAWETVPAQGTLPTQAEWHTGPTPPGDYQLIVQVYDAQTSQLLAERGTPITIDPTLALGGGVAFDPPLVLWSTPTPVALQAQVQNRGNQPLATAITATVTLKTLGYQQQQARVDVELITQGQGLTRPWGLDRDAAGNLYVANFGTGAVLKVSPAGVVSPFATGFVNPADVALGPNGTFYVLERSGALVRQAADGSRIKFLATSLSIQSGWGVQALADGRVLIAAEQATIAVAPNGTVQRLIGAGLADPQGLVIDRQGTVFIADRGANSIVRFSDGQLSPWVTGISQPYGLTLDAADNLYVASFGSNSLLKVTPGGVVSTVATGLAGPRDVALAPSGDLVVAQNNSDSIVTVSPTGAMSTRVPASLNAPQAAAFDSAGVLYVGNTGANNVVKLPATGPPVPVASGVTPRGLLSETDGSLLVLQSDRLVRITPDGRQMQITSALSTASNLVALDGGYVVNEQSLNRLSHVTPAGVVTPYSIPLFENPTALRIDASGEVGILSRQGYLTAVTPTGVVRRVASDLGTVESGVGRQTHGLARALDGTWYVSDYFGRRVLAIDAVGTVRVVVTLSFRPGALAVTPQGALLVATYGADAFGNVISKVEGAVVTEFARLNTVIDYDLLVTADGAVWVVHNAASRVTRVAPDGSQQPIVLASPRGLAPASQGSVYVAMQGGIRQIDATGRVTDVAVGVALQNQSFYGVGQTPDGQFWALNSTGLLYRLHTDGTVVTKYTSLSRPKGLAVSSGALLVAHETALVRISAPNTLPEVLLDGAYQRVVAEPTGTGCSARALRWRALTRSAAP